MPGTEEDSEDEVIHADHLEPTEPLRTERELATVELEGSRAERVVDLQGQEFRSSLMHERADVVRDGQFGAPGDTFDVDSEALDAEAVGYPAPARG